LRKKNKIIQKRNKNSTTLLDKGIRKEIGRKKKC
jgi:hypothetical protein